jgi:hypothetical protein
VLNTRSCPALVRAVSASGSGRSVTTRITARGAERCRGWWMIAEVRFGNQLIAAGMREDRRSRKDCESDAHCPEPHLSTSVKSGNRTKMRRRPARKIEHHFIDVTPAPPFRRIIGLDDRVPGRVKMFCCVPIWRLIAATDMAAGATDPQMQPGVTRFQAFLAPRRARNNVADCREMFAKYRHIFLCSAAQNAPHSALSYFRSDC